MKKYTVKQVSELLNIPKDTLIYYDKLDIVKPQRGDNGYRYYSDDDINDLKYVEVMKNIEYSLDEIRQTLVCQKHPTKEGFQWQREFIGQKKIYLENKIKHTQEMIELITIAEKLMEEKLNSGSADTEILRGFIDNIFENWRKGKK